jgi:hypothetical protein
LRKRLHYRIEIQAVSAMIADTVKKCKGCEDKAKTGMEERKNIKRVKLKGYGYLTTLLLPQ